MAYFFRRCKGFPSFRWLWSMDGNVIINPPTKVAETIASRHAEKIEIDPKHVLQELKGNNGDGFNFAVLYNLHRLVLNVALCHIKKQILILIVLLNVDNYISCLSSCEMPGVVCKHTVVDSYCAQGRRVVQNGSEQSACPKAEPT